MKAYQFLFNPIRGRQFWLTSEEGLLEVPMARSMPWRPVKRKREALEGINKSQTKISKEDREMMCRICLVEGYSRIHCP